VVEAGFGKEIANPSVKTADLGRALAVETFLVDRFGQPFSVSMDLAAGTGSNHNFVLGTDTERADLKQTLDDFFHNQLATLASFALVIHD
jgi:hypothetical protein